MSNMIKAVKIDPRGWYTLQDLVQEQVFPWASSFFSVRKVVQTDLAGKNLLKATITGTGRGTKYLFYGANIIKFINAVESGKVRLTK